MRKVLLSISLALALSFNVSSCNDWLDGAEQTSTISDEVVWQDEAYVGKYVNAFYTYLSKYRQLGEAQFSGSLTKNLAETFEYGLVALGDRAGRPDNYVTNPDVVSPDEYRYNIWDEGLAYSNIRQANQLLVMQKKCSALPNDKNLKWGAQARFFRAYAYFRLAKRHGGVVLCDDLPTSDDGTCSAAAEAWQFIADDLGFAATNLPREWDAASRGRVTKGATYVLRSRAMLYAERWQGTYDAAGEVEKLQLYGLMDNYVDAWKGNNKEAILKFDYNKDSGPSHTLGQYYVPQCDGYNFGALGTPTQEMVESYEDKNGNRVDWSEWHDTTTKEPPYDQLEPCFAATIIYRDCTWKGRVMDCSVGGADGAFMTYREQSYSYGKTTTGCFLCKLLDKELIDVKGTKSSRAWVEIQFAEVLLNKAEAAYGLNKTTEVQSLMSRVRERQGVSLPDKSSSGEAWFNDYRNEREIELAYEGYLFWDIRRWRLARIEYSNCHYHGPKITSGTYEYIDYDGQDRKFLQKLYVLPVPTSEMKNNALIEQYSEWK